MPFYTVIQYEMDPKVAKLVNLAKIWTCRPLIRPIIHQRVMLECPESLKSLHKLVLPENVSKSAFYMVLQGKIANQRGQNTGLGSQNGRFRTLKWSAYNRNMSNFS